MDLSAWSDLTTQRSASVGRAGAAAAPLEARGRGGQILLLVVRGSFEHVVDHESDADDGVHEAPVIDKNTSMPLRCAV